MFWTNKKFAKTEKKSWKKLVKQVCEKIRLWLINENCHIFQIYSFAIIFDIYCALSMSNIIKEFVRKNMAKQK